MATVLKAATERMLLVLKRLASMSAKVYLPRFRMGSATSRSNTKNVTRNPIER